MRTLLLLCTLTLGIQAFTYNEVGPCKDDIISDYDDDLNGFQLPIAAYAHSITKLPGYELIDGIFFHAVLDDDSSDIPVDPTDAPVDPSDAPDCPSSTANYPNPDDPTDAPQDPIKNLNDPSYRPDGLLASATVYKTDGSIISLNYTTTPVTSFALEETYTQPNGEILYFVLYNLGMIPECKVSVMYRCAFEGTNSLDIINVMKSENKPLSDECEAKVVEAYTNKGLVVSPQIKFPYKLNNYN